MRSILERFVERSVPDDRPWLILGEDLSMERSEHGKAHSVTPIDGDRARNPRPRMPYWILVPDGHVGLARRSHSRARTIARSLRAFARRFRDPSAATPDVRH